MKRIGATAPDDEAEGESVGGSPSVASRPKRKRKETLLDHWSYVMTPVLFKVDCGVHVQRPQFWHDIKYLREKRGLTDDKIRELIDTFALSVKAGNHNLAGKNAWRVFLGAWPKLAGTTQFVEPDAGSSWQRR